MKKIVTHFVFPLVALFGLTSATSIAQNQTNSTETPTGMEETLIVASGAVTMQLDLNRLNGASVGKTSNLETVRFQAINDSYFPVIAFNNELRGVDVGSVGLLAGNPVRLPAALNASFNQLVIEKTPSENAYEFVVRDGKTGFVFFNIAGSGFTYDAKGRALQMADGRLLVSEEFARAMGRPSDVDAFVGTISMAAKLRLIESKNVVNGAAESAILPAPNAPTAVAGPDVIVGDLPAMQQVGTSAGGRVGVVVATTSCNNGNVELNWFALSNTDHPVIPQNVYRMSGGASNTDRFEQIGQSWLKHAFTALQQTVCGTCTAAVNGTHLGVGCSDPYGISENMSQTSLGSRAWVNPFTGAFPNTANSHTGHTHDGTSHRVLVEINDLNTTLNPGATYYGEGQYVTPHEYAWCQAHAGECNMYNNVSYRRFTVTGTSSFTFATSGSTVRQSSAINAWTGATINKIEPAPGVDGQGFVGYKVSGPVGGVYHYEYAVYNQNMDRGIQSFSVPLGCGVSLTNVGFHAPPNPPSFTNDNLAAGGLSNAAWTANQSGGAVTWASETLAQNANANAIRWGTLYNFRFDSTQPPQTVNATVGFFKTGSPITVAVQGPTSQCTALQLVSVVSRKTHGSQDYDIDMPLSGAPGVECRRGGANGDHTLIFTFSNTLANGGASITTDKGGSISGSPTFVGNTMTVNLAAVANAQRATINLNGVTDSFGQTMANTGVQLGFLLGDTTGDGVVNVGDALQTRGRSGQALDMTNFRSDVTVDGFINVGDVLVVKGKSGTSLDDPPAPGEIVTTRK